MVADQRAGAARALVLMRLFLALPLSGADTRAVYDACERFSPQDRVPLRWVPAENWHVTLLFLGEVAEHLLGNLAELVAPAVASCRKLSLRLDELNWFPSVARARLLVLTGEADAALLDLQQSLAAELRRGGFSVEQRPWRPHLTLARYRGTRKRFEPLTLPPVRPLDLEPGCVSLFQSVSGPRGSAPRYLPLHQFELSP